MAGAQRILGIVLAAGEGTRMKSAKPKVLHEVAGLSLVGHALTSAHQAGVTDLAVVIGPERPDVAAEIARRVPEARVFEQRQQQLVLTVELQVEAPQGLPGPIHHLLDGEIGAALLGDDRLGGVEEALHALFREQPGLAQQGVRQMKQRRK